MDLTRPAEWPLNGSENAREFQQCWPQKGDLRKLHCQQRMSVVASHATALPVSAFQAGVDARWEAGNRTVWNEQERASEERELVFEFSWIEELGVWGRFLPFQRKV